MTALLIASILRRLQYFFCLNCNLKKFQAGSIHIISFNSNEQLALLVILRTSYILKYDTVNTCCLVSSLIVFWACLDVLPKSVIVECIVYEKLMFLCSGGFFFSVDSNLFSAELIIFNRAEKQIKSVTISTQKSG